MLPLLFIITIKIERIPIKLLRTEQRIQIMPTSNKAFQRFLTHGLALAVSTTLSAGLATTVSAQTGALAENFPEVASLNNACLLYTSPSPRD